MLITLDVASSQVSIELNEITTVVDFSTITADVSWTSNKKIAIVLDNIDAETSTNLRISLNESSFLRNITHHIETQRDNVNDYYNERNTYKLWRLLDGDSESDIELDIQNIESQRYALESIKTEYLANEDASLADHLAKMQANTDRAEKEKQLNTAQYNYDSTIIILSGYDSGNGLLIGAFSEYLPLDLQGYVSTYVSDQMAINELLVSANLKTDEINRFIGLKANLEQRIANLDPEDPNYAGDLAALEAQVDDAQGGIDAASNDLDVINFNLNAARATLKVDEAPVLTGLQQFRDDQLALIETYTSELADMPYYENLGAAPEKTEIGTVVSTEMRKLLAAVNDESKPQITLRNVSRELVYQSYERRGVSLNTDE